MPIGAVLGIGSALIGASSASKAAKSQTNAANKDIAFQKETRDQVVAKLDPFYQGGTAANAALLYEMGLGPKPMVGGVAPTITEIPGVAATQPSAPARPGTWQYYTSQRGGTGGTAATPAQFKVGDQTFATREEAQAYADANKTGATEYQGFQASPGYQFALDQGNASVNALAGARGGLNSGATLQALQENGIGMANQEYGNWWNRLSGIAGSGQNAAAQQGTAMTNAAGAISNAYGNIGNAKAAGAIGVSNAINGGIQNYLGYQQYQNGLTKPAPGMTYGTPYGIGMSGSSLIPPR